jgi:hypothetical protein
LKEADMKLRISENAWTRLRGNLFQRTDVETAGLMFGERVETISGTVVVVREAFALPESAYAIRKIDQLSIDPIALNRLIRPARDNGWSIFTIHTHPGASEAWFSHADDAGDTRLMPSLCCQIEGVPHGSVVVIDNGDTVARVFAAKSGFKEIEIQIIGRTLQSPRRVISNSEPWFARQELALGARGQAQLRRLRVAVIGLGGVGSVVSMQLAHLGIGELVLIDGDIVEASNLSRIAVAVEADVGRTYKVHVAARYAKALGFTRVETYAEFVGAAHESILAGCDVIISCVDMQTPRALLNRIAYRYLIPMIDLGIVFRVNDAGSVVGDAGRVVILGPGRPCLACWGHLDPNALRIEALSPEEREEEIRLGYIEGAVEAQPSVIAFNTFVAGAGVMELMRIATAFAGAEKPPLRMEFSFSAGTVRRNVVMHDPSCRICG